ncbi:VOC family protein [Deinococcus frigens]|uniref:VOC family protein n=1 Tax=Deinococcus frigens TaxID=249403 RepID=UPI000495C50E|nr:VOC family protein [Deinococcus frigens]
MSVRFNHALLAAYDRRESATFFAHLFGLNAPTFWGPFATVHLADETHLQFDEPGADAIQMQHLAFLVDERTFDEIYGRMVEGRTERRADPQMTWPGQINSNHGRRGVYFNVPAGHGLEIITRPYSEKP